LKQDIEKEIRKYIEENAGTTENKVVEHMTNNKISSRMTTLDKIDSLRNRKIIRDLQEGNSFHRLYVDDVSTFSKIEKELAEIEHFINKGNSYFRERVEENRAKANSDMRNEIEEMTLTKRIEYVNLLEFKYRETVTRMLEDIFIISNTNLSKQDSERFYKKIIELKTKLAYHDWTKDIEKTYYKRQIQNIKTIERNMKEKGLEQYLEENNLDTKFLRPFEAKIQKFMNSLL
jgi:hypothetical protein